MTGARLLGLTLLATAVAVAHACARRPVTAPARPSVSLVVLLADPDDKTVGRVTVSNPAGAVDLRADREATRVISGQRPPAGAPMDDAELRRIFGEVLAVLPPAPRHFILYFKFDSDELTDESQRLVREILQVVAQRPVPDVMAVGHTDTTGSAASNYELGLRRATILRNLLVANGLDPSLIEIASHGEADLLVQTPDETLEPRNRRVEVEVK